MLQGPCSVPVLTGRSGWDKHLWLRAHGPWRLCDPGYHAASAGSLVTSLDKAGLFLVISCGFFKIQRNHNGVCCSLQELYLDFWLHNNPGISYFLSLFQVFFFFKEDKST